MTEDLATNLRITDALIRYAMLLQQIADLGILKDTPKDTKEKPNG